MSLRYFAGSLTLLTGVAALIAAEPLTKPAPVPEYFADYQIHKPVPELASTECCQGQFATAKTCSLEAGTIQYQILLVQMPSSIVMSEEYVDIMTASCDLADASYSWDRKKHETKSALRVFTPKQTADWMELASRSRSSSVMQAPRMTGSNGESMTCQVGEAKEFITGLTVEDQKGQAVLAPKKESIFLGKQFEVVGTVSPDKQSVRLTLKGKLTDLEGKPKTLPVELKLAVAEQTSTTHVIQRPTINRADFSLDAVVPNNKTVLLPLKQTEPDAPRRFLLVTPHIVEAERTARDVVVVPFCPEECVGKCETKCDACPSTCQQAKAVAQTAAAQAMTLEDIVKMSEVGVSDQVIANQIWITDTNLTLSTQDIIYLKKQNVTNEVIQAIQERAMQMIQQSVPMGPQSVSR